MTALATAHATATTLATATAAVPTASIGPQL
jgi:hypothetical protein